MLALFLHHPPMFVAGEIALGLSLAVFVVTLIAAIADRASEVLQLREGGPPPLIVRRPAPQRSPLVRMFRVRLRPSSNVASAEPTVRKLRTQKQFPPFVLMPTVVSAASSANNR